MIRITYSNGWEYKYYPSHLVREQNKSKEKKDGNNRKNQVGKYNQKIPR